MNSLSILVDFVSLHCAISLHILEPSLNITDTEDSATSLTCDIAKQVANYVIGNLQFHFHERFQETWLALNYQLLDHLDCCLLEYQRLPASQIRPTAIKNPDARVDNWVPKQLPTLQCVFYCFFHSSPNFKREGVE